MSDKLVKLMWCGHYAEMKGDVSIRTDKEGSGPKKVGPGTTIEVSEKIAVKMNKKFPGCLLPVEEGEALKKAIAAKKEAQRIKDKALKDALRKPLSEYMVTQKGKGAK